MPSGLTVHVAVVRTVAVVTGLFVAPVVKVTVVRAGLETVVAVDSSVPQMQLVVSPGSPHTDDSVCCGQLS